MACLLLPHAPGHRVDQARCRDSRGGQGGGQGRDLRVTQHVPSLPQHPDPLSQPHGQRVQVHEACGLDTVGEVGQHAVQAFDVQQARSEFVCHGRVSFCVSVRFLIIIFYNEISNFFSFNHGKFLPFLPRATVPEPMPCGYPKSLF